MILTKAQEEALNWTQEEAAEVIQIISKIKRHGMESYHPHVENACSNQEELKRELSDLMLAICTICDLKVVNRGEVMNGVFKKAILLENENYFHHLEFKNLKAYPLDNKSNI